MRGSKKADLAIETGFAPGAARRWRKHSASGALVGGKFLACGALDAGPEPAVRAGGPAVARRHAGRGLCRNGNHRLHDVFNGHLRAG